MDEAEDAPPARARPAWWERGLRLLLGLIIAAAIAVAGFVAILDTGIGHRLILDRVAALAPESGLRIRIGRIEGSIWGRTGLRDVRLYDQEGLFAEAPQIAMDWRPVSLLFNRLLIHDLASDLVILHRLPDLIAPEDPGPILPDLDINVGRLSIARVRIGEAVTGTERSGSLSGELDIRSGRALAALAVDVADGGDRLRLRLDAEPDRDRFDLALALDAPADGVIGAMLGTRRPLRAGIAGEGSWTRWAGAGRFDLDGRRAASLDLTMEEGLMRARGWAAPSPFLQGKLQRLSAPRILLDAEGRIGDGLFDGRLSARSPALRVEARGGIHLTEGGWRDVRVAAALLRPAALFPGMTGRDVRLAALLDGRFGRATFAYRLTAPFVAFDGTGFERVRAEGRGSLTRAPVRVPVTASAARVTGLGPDLGAILAGLRLAGTLEVTPARIAGQRLALASAAVRGTGDLSIDLASGAYVVDLDAMLPRYEQPGLGQVDVAARLRAVPAPGGRGTLVTGDARAAVRRLDNGFLNWVGGGLPRLESRVVRGPDTILRFEGLRVEAPDIALAGSGQRRRDGTFFFDGTGRHAQYGPFAMTLDGAIDRPRVALRLDAPLDALGLADVSVDLDPSAEGFAYRAEGGSALGPFASAGAILLPDGADPVLAVERLAVSRSVARGRLVLGEGGFAGALDISGGGLSGRIAFSPVNGVQRIAAAIDADDAAFLGDPPIAIRSGRLEGVALLDSAGTSLSGRLNAHGVSLGALSVARLSAEAEMRGGVGTVAARIAGTRHRTFAFDARADIAPGRIRIGGEGTLDGQRIALERPALLTREDVGWRLGAARLSYGSGSLDLEGLFGGERSDFAARLEAMPLTILDMFSPDLGLGGIASGRIAYRTAQGVPAAGEMDVRVRGLTRAGLVLSSRPVDIGIAARLRGDQAAMRAVAASEGRTVGRAQARVAPLGRAGTLFDRIANGALFGQLRYNGPADTLWRLTGVELIDLTGPLAVGADVGGSLADPRIRGSLRMDGARMESAVTGMVIEGISAAGRFDGSRLVLDEFSGGTAGGGRVSARGAFDLAAANGFGMDIAVNAESARLLDRDDIRTDVTGPLAIRSDGAGGRISGDVRLVGGAFRLGSVAAVTEVPRLAVRERGGEEDHGVARPVAPWQLALNVVARNRMMVTGLGLASEWSADVRVAGTVTEPRITGEAALVRGTYDFAGRRFDLERGAIRFTGESPVNPELDIVAEGGIQGLNATIRVTGRAEAPEIAFTSIPALPQDELLSRLLFGTSITNLSAAEAIQLAAAVASLNEPGGGLDPINAVRAAIGLDRLRILPADITTGQGTAIAAGRYLTRRVYVEVVTDGRGYSATLIEYQITRWLSLLSSISTIGRESVNVRVSRDY